MWRGILREFNLAQLIRIVQKCIIKIDAIFESDLVNSRSNTSFKGYQQTFEDFLNNTKSSSAEDACGPVHVELDDPAVTQLWDEVKGIIEMTNSWMLPFLKKFGVIDGNGLSPFAVDIETPVDLRQLIEQFFCTQKRDTRGNNSTTNCSNNEGSAEEDVIDDELMGSSEALGSPAKPASAAPSPSVIAAHMRDIATADRDANDDDSGGDEDSIASEDDETSSSVTDSDLSGQEVSIDGGNSSASFAQFKVLLRHVTLGGISNEALNLIEFLQIGKLEKGAVSTSSKFKSRNDRWFTAKQKKNAPATDECDRGADDLAEGELYVQQWYSLITTRCKCGNSKTIEHYRYRILAFFIIFYNKWFLSLDDKFLWGSKDAVKMKNPRVLARLMKKSGSVYTQVKLEKRGDLGPKDVYCIKSLNDVVVVECDLIDM